MYPVAGDALVLLVALGGPTLRARWASWPNRNGNGVLIQPARPFKIVNHAASLSLTGVQIATTRSHISTSNMPMWQSAWEIPSCCAIQR